MYASTKYLKFLCLPQTVNMIFIVYQLHQGLIVKRSIENYCRILFKGTVRALVITTIERASITSWALNHNNNSSPHTSPQIFSVAFG